MNVSIYSRKAIQKRIEDDFPANTAVISFYDPKDSKGYGNSTPVDYREQCERIFYVCIRDIDIEVLENFGLTFATYFPEVDELADFIFQAKKDGLDILCQCEYGQSRSSACAAAILEYFYGNGISIFADYRYYPNQLIFNKILNSLKKKAKTSWSKSTNFYSEFTITCIICTKIQVILDVSLHFAESLD